MQNWVARNIISHPDYNVFIIKVILISLLAILKIGFNNRFKSYMLLIFSQKYINIYGKDSKSWAYIFNLIINVIHILIISSFIWHLFDIYLLQTHIELGWLVDSYIYITALVTIFVISKSAIQLWISKIFGCYNIFSKMFFEKTSYHSYACLFLYVYLLIFVGNEYYNAITTYIFLLLYLIMLLIGYISSIIDWRNIISQNLFYYILYICTLEIAPLVIFYKLFIII